MEGFPDSGTLVLEGGLDFRLLLLLRRQGRVVPLERVVDLGCEVIDLSILVPVREKDGLFTEASLFIDNVRLRLAVD